MKKVVNVLIIFSSTHVYAANIGGLEQQKIDNNGVAGVHNINSPSTENKIIPYGIDPNTLKTIKAKSRTNEENRNHQLFCNEMGGIDITDTTDIQISNDTIDAIFCQITNKNKFEKYVQNKKLEYTQVTNNKLIKVNPNDSIANGTWQAFAPSGSVNDQYYATSVGVFNNLSGQAYIDVSVPSDRCSASNQAPINGSGRFTATTICGYFSHGQQPSYANACFNGSCVQNRGWINHTR